MKYFKAFLPVVVFLLVQAFCGVVCLILGYLQSGSFAQPFSTTTVSLCSIFSGVLTVVLCWRPLRVVRLPEALFGNVTSSVSIGSFVAGVSSSVAGVDSTVAGVGSSVAVNDAKGAKSPETTKASHFILYMGAVIGSLCACFATNLLSEQLNLVDLLEDNMIALGHSVLGVIALVCVGPIVEELVFREAVCGHLLRAGVRPVWAILFSALCFGVAHMNPAQVPFAFLMALPLGILYWKTGNIRLSAVVHVLNNGLAVIQMLVLGDAVKDFTLTNWLGGTASAFFWMIIMDLFAIAMLWHFTIRMKSPIYYK